jgi:hypothetical protein
MSRLYRRAFLESAGLATLFAPFLGLLRAPEAKAQAPGPFENLLLFCTPGTDVTQWSPRGSTDMAVSFSEMTEPLSAIKSNVILVEKLSSNGTADSHGAPGGLTGIGYGAPTHISIEQWVSDRLPQAPIKNVLLGGVSTEQQTTFFRDGRALSPITSLSAAHQAIFGGFMPADPMAPVDPMTPDDKLRRRRSMLDLVKAELTALSDTLGAAERQKLELHADSIRQLELTLQSGSGGGTPPATSCTVPAVPGAETDVLLNSAKHLELAVNALACGRTHVAAVQFGHHQNTQVSLPEVGAPGDWHNTFMHSDMAPRRRLIELEKWLCKQFVAAVESLKAIPLADGSGTLFDKTLVVWARDMGDGVLHSGSDMRFVFAGGANGYLKLSSEGRYIDGKGAAHQNALISICDALGVDDYQGFGSSSIARAPLAGLKA